MLPMRQAKAAGHAWQFKLGQGKPWVACGVGYEFSVTADEACRSPRLRAGRAQTRRPAIFSPFTGPSWVGLLAWGPPAAGAGASEQDGLPQCGPPLMEEQPQRGWQRRSAESGHN